MKKSIFIIILSLLVASLAGCQAASSPPNPGFRAHTLIQTGTLPKPLRQTNTDGTYFRSLSTPTYGNETYFNEYTGNGWMFDVEDGKAPGLWYVNAGAG